MSMNVNDINNQKHIRDLISNNHMTSQMIKELPSSNGINVKRET